MLYPSELQARSVPPDGFDRVAQFVRLLHPDDFDRGARRQPYAPNSIALHPVRQRKTALLLAPHPQPGNHLQAAVDEGDGAPQVKSRNVFAFFSRASAISSATRAVEIFFSAAARNTRVMRS